MWRPQLDGCGRGVLRQAGGQTRADCGRRRARPVGEAGKDATQAQAAVDASPADNKYMLRRASGADTASQLPTRVVRTS